MILSKVSDDESIRITFLNVTHRRKISDNLIFSFTLSYSF